VKAAHEHSLQYAGVRVHVRDLGEGPPVLLINGLGAHIEMWAEMENTLHGFRLIEFDGPGAGRSSTPRLPTSIRGVAALAVRVLDEAGIERADVVGYSMGGIVAQQLALDAPDRVRRVVLAATTCGLGAVPVNTLAMLNLVTPVRFLSPGMYTRVLGNLTGGRAREDREWAASVGVLRLRHTPSPRGYIWQMVSLMGWTSLPHLSRIRQPTLVIAGGDDPLAPPVNAMLLAHAIPGARLLVAAGEGHLMVIDEDSMLHDAIRDFLSAESLDVSDAWREARHVSAGELQAQIPATRCQAQPWGIVGVLMRRLWLADGDER